MFAAEIRHAVDTAPRMKLPDVAALLWRAYGAGHLTEAEAEELSALIEVRKVPPASGASAGGVPQQAPRRSVGSRPRSDASMERRRRWAASGRLPPQIACRFTLAEAAVLATMALQVAKHGDCRLSVGTIAALAGVSETTVRNALRRARALALVTVEERRLAAWRNHTNVVRIVAREWLAWMRLRPRGAGAQDGGRGHPAAILGAPAQAHEAASLPVPVRRRDATLSQPEGVGADSRTPRVRRF